MSSLNRTKGSTFTLKSMARLVSTIEGIPSENLLGLYFLDESHSGNAVTAWKDSSGNGYDATLYANAAMPTKLSPHGYQTPDNNGIFFDSGIKAITIKEGYTVIWAGKHTVTSYPSGYPTQSGITDGLPSDVNGSVNNNVGMFSNVQLTSDKPLDNYGVYSDLAGVSRISNYNSNGRGLKASVTAHSVNFITGEIKQYIHTTLKVSTDTRDQIKNYYDDKTGNFVFGQWKHTTTPISGEIYACAIYKGQLDDATTLSAIKGMKAALESRGVVFEQ